MMVEHMHGFIEDLISQTSNGKLIWHPLRAYPNLTLLLDELNYTYSSIDLFTNSIRIIGSYYLSHNTGVILLLEIYHHLTETTGILNVYIRPNEDLPLSEIDLGKLDLPETQKKLEVLRLTIEKQIDYRYSFPDTLYKFCDSVTNH